MIVYVVRLLRRPADSDQAARVTERMGKVASAPPPAVIAAGAGAGRPGALMLLAAKSISQLDPSTAQYLVDWTLFVLVILLPFGTALLMLVIAPRFGLTPLVATRM